MPAYDAAGLLPRKFDRYIEPFVGSGASLLYMRETRQADRWLVGDLNEAVTILHSQVRDAPQNVARSLRQLVKDHCKEFYQETQRYHRNAMMRERSNRPGESKTAARVIYLSNAGFNGLWRESDKSGHNTPFGDRPQERLPTDADIEAAHRLMVCEGSGGGVEIQHADYLRLLGLAKTGDFVYLDPPYLPAAGRKNSFTQYIQGHRFEREHHEQLADAMAAAVGRGAMVACSNALGPDEEAIYGSRSEFDVAHFRAYRSMAPTRAGRGFENEVLITGGY